MAYVDRWVLLVFRAWFSICWPEPAGRALEMFLGFRRTLVTGSKKDCTLAIDLEALGPDANARALEIALRRGHLLVLNHQSSQLKADSAVVNGGGY